MLNILEQKNPGIFSNKDFRWLDPCNGTGNFPICIYYRLMDGLQEEIPDKKERKRHIIETMIYVCEIDSDNIEIYKQIMKGKLNIYHDDYLSFSPEYFSIDKFDVVIGNPPYQKNNKEGSYGSSLPYYNEFITHSLDIKSDRTMFVTPSRWFAGGKGLDNFRSSMLDRTDIQVIEHYPRSKDVFKHVNIEGGVNIILFDKEYKGDCEFRSEGVISNIKLSDYDIICDPRYIELIKEFENLEKLSSIFKTSVLYSIETNDKRLEADNSDDRLKCFVSQVKGFVKYIECDTVPLYKNNKHHKVITARANGKNKCFGNMFVSTPEDVYTKSYISFVTGNNEESESLISYLQCKLPNVMLGLRKISQDISKKTCSWIPLVPLDRIWTDEEVNNYFKLSKKLVCLIDDYIKEYSIVLKKEMKQEKPTIRFEEVDLIYPDETVKTMNNKSFETFKVTELKTIARNNNINLSGIKTKIDIINRLMSRDELTI